MIQEEWIKKLEAEGWRDINVVKFAANFEVPEHIHDERTVHVILEGELTLTEGEKAVKHIAGEQFETPAGTTHRGKCGSAGCTFIVGVQ